MPEYYKKVVCTQFTLTDAEKEAISKGQHVDFEGQRVKQTAAGRYHVLYPIADRLIPLHESDWIVRNPEIEIKRDYEFRSQFVSYDNIDPVAVQKRLDDIMAERNQGKDGRKGNDKSAAPVQSNEIH